MPRVMLYCQYLSGMGHLVRSTELARALSKEFETIFINGGPKIKDFELPASVEPIYLPALWLEAGQFRVASGDNVEEVKAFRQRTLLENFDRLRPDCVITEFFPFGRHDLLFELRPWMRHIARIAPDTLVVSSLRDTIGKTTLGEQTRLIADLINEYFDLVLFHADPRFQRFEECFPEAEALNCPVVHTGFVAQQPPSEPVPIEQPFVLVSVGGGRLGYEVLDYAIEAAGLLKSRLPHRFIMFSGPFMEPASHEALLGKARLHDNVSFERFTPNLLHFMAQADLSISLAGYNTTMNILSTGVRAIVVPIGHYDFDHEQVLRTRKLAARGVADVLLPEDLNPSALAAAIIRGLEQPSARTCLDLEGAATTAATIKQSLAHLRSDSRPIANQEALQLA